MKKIALFVAAVLVAPMIAQADIAATYNVQLDYDNASHRLVTVVTETATSQNACDLVLTRFEYLADVKLVNVEFSPDFCPMEIVGNRKGTVSWQLPRDLRQTGEFNLRVNGKVLGKVTINGSANAASLHIRK